MFLIDERRGICIPEAHFQVSLSYRCVTVIWWIFMWLFICSRFSCPCTSQDSWNSPFPHHWVDIQPCRGGQEDLILGSSCSFLKSTMLGSTTSLLSPWRRWLSTPGFSWVLWSHCTAPASAWRSVTSKKTGSACCSLPFTTQTIGTCTSTWCPCYGKESIWKEG